MKTQDIPKAFRTLLVISRTISALITPRLQKLKPKVEPIAPTCCTGVVFTPVGMWIAKPNTLLFLWRLEFSQLTPFIYTATHARELNYFLHVQFRTRVKYRKTVVVRVTGCDPKSANSIRTWPRKKTYVRNLPLSHDTVQNTRTSPTSQPKKNTKPKTQTQVPFPSHTTCPPKRWRWLYHK